MKYSVIQNLAKKALSTCGSLALGLQFSCANANDSRTTMPTSAAEGKKAQLSNILEVAQSNESFSTLVKAVQVAGLEDALRTSPALTVFAPTNEAFAKLPGATLEALLKDKEALKNVLLYHVVGSVVPSSRAVQLQEATMLNGKTTSLNYDGTTLFINSAKVIAADVAASNGIIHVIDTVLVPATQNIVQQVERKDLISTAEAAGGFSTLLTAVRAAGLEQTLRAAKDVTLFAPTDEAFAKLPEGTVSALLADPEALRNVLLYHVVGARVSAEVASTLTEAVMLNGSKVSITACEDGLKINDSRVIATDIDGGNGVIHVLDSVLIPGK